QELKPWRAATVRLAVWVREFPESPVPEISVQHIPAAARVAEMLEPLPNQPSYARRDGVPSELSDEILLVGTKIIVHALRFRTHRIALHRNATVEGLRGRRLRVRGCTEYSRAPGAE